MLMRHPQLGHDVVELVLAKHREDLDVALRVMRKAPSEYIPGGCAR
jgi:hypothetical protein